MEAFELQRYVTIGQYLPGDSIVHRLDPRTKISAFIFLIVAVTFSRSYTANVLLLLATLGLVLLAHISTRYIFSGLKPAVPFIVVVALLQFLFYGYAYNPYGVPIHTLFQWGWIHVTNGSVQLIVVSFLRFVVLLFVVSLLTNATRLTDLTHGMEAMLRPFARLGLPAHELSLVATVALRFIPLLAEQLENIIKAQASRGAAVSPRGRMRFLTTIQQMLVFIVPLFVDAFRRAEDLIVAMQARCYMGGRGRTSYVRLRFQPIDYLAIVVTLAFSTTLLVFANRLPF